MRESRWDGGLEGRLRAESGMRKLCHHGDREAKELSPGTDGLSVWIMANLIVFISSSTHSSIHADLFLTALTKVIDDLHVFKSKKCLLILILLDFSASCDIVNYSLFLAWSLSLASKTTHCPYLFPTSLAPGYQSLPGQYRRDFPNRV